MAVKLRLTRIGRIHRPFFRIGAFDSRTRRDGEALEYLGYYDPILSTGQRVKLDKERVEAWIAKGAQPTETVACFLREAGIRYKKVERTRARNKAHSEGRRTSRAARKGKAGGKQASAAKA